MLKCTQWSNDLIEYTANLCHHLKTHQILSSIELIRATRETLPLPSVGWHSPDALLRIMFEIFQNLPIHEKAISTYLSPNEIKLIQKIIDSRIIQSLDDFHYLIHHLPFQRGLITLLDDYLKYYYAIPEPFIRMIGPLCHPSFKVGS